jgi:2-polyprenyl-6-hydroxyphenyl methylase/3-demethylubiquinone-9 3-methyltransferase
MKSHSYEIAVGERFEFGANWRGFLVTLDEERAAVAEQSLREMLGVASLANKRFLDAGSGSGLFSLAARRLGAAVHSFDFDPQSVRCTRELRSRFFDEDDPQWTIQEGSVLDEEYLRSLGQFDVVYSWGVLHHTGNMWKALETVTLPVAPGGRLFISIYNDQGIRSRFWKAVKRTYCASRWGKLLITGLFVPYFALMTIVVGLVQDGTLLGHFKKYKNNRGMSAYHDWIDWLGGYPFEVARPEDIFHFCEDRGFRLLNLKTTNGIGCNQFVFGKLQ